MLEATMCTVSTAAQLSSALALAESWRDAGGADPPLVVVADALPGTLHPVDGVRLVTGADLNLDDFEVLASEHPANELCRVLLPFVLESWDGPMVYLAPESIVLADVSFPDADLVLVAQGGLNDSPVADAGFAGLPRPCPELVQWWQARMRDGDASAHWFDILLGRFPQVDLVRDDAWGVTAWNWDDREIDATGPHLVTADGRRVAWLSLPTEADAAASAAEALPAIELDARPALRLVLERRLAAIQRLSSSGEHVVAGYGTTADGLVLTPRVRRLLTVARREDAVRPSVFHPAPAAAFRVWLQEPSGEPASGGVSRLAFEVWLELNELRLAYPDLNDQADREGLIRWLATHGKPQLDLPADILPRRPETLAQAQPRARRPARPWGVNVAGYFQSELGIGEVARRMLDALDAAHVPALPVQGSVTPPSRRAHDFGSTTAEVAPFAFNLICVNADGLPQFARDVGPGFFDARRSIGLWWWEVADFPERYHQAFRYVDEIWVGSEHVQRAIGPRAPVPVVHVPVALRVLAPPVRSRADLGLPEGFLVLVSFDFNSVMKRKNPIGALDAFVRAFSVEGEAELVIKTVNASLHPREHAELVRAAATRSDVHVLDGYVDEREMRALLASADVYLSLHRSEGFGLGLAESMALGTPVVATGYSGNLDFMDDRTGWLVPFDLVPIGPGADPYPASGSWADPDLGAAAAALRAIRDSPTEAKARAERGRARIAERHAPEVVGAVMARRLELLRLDFGQEVRPPARGFDNVRTRLDEARAQAAQPVSAHQRKDVGRLRRRIQQGVRRAGAPLDAVRRISDDALLDAVDELQRETEAVSEDALVLYALALARARRAEERIALLERRLDELVAEQADGPS